MEKPQINPIKSIKKFSEIIIIPNSLVVLDIDDTLIKFDGIDFKWWRNKFNRYYKITQQHELSEQLSNGDWIKIIQKCDAELVDNEIHQFINKIKENNCEIILLTARNDKLRELTIKHLADVNLYFTDIYFNGEKGDELKKISLERYPNINNIIVVDDLKQNLEDIKEKMNGLGVNLHLYNIIA